MVKGYLMHKSADKPYRDWDRLHRRGKKRIVTYVEPQTKAAMAARSKDEGVSMPEWLRRVIARELTLSGK